MIFPTTAKEMADRLREYLPQFARPLLDKLVARVEYEAAGRALDTLRGCKTASGEIEDGCEIDYCCTCERFQPVDRSCALREAPRVAPGPLIEELRVEFGPYFDRIADVDAWVRAVRSGDDPPATATQTAEEPT